MIACVELRTHETLWGRRMSQNILLDEITVDDAFMKNHLSIPSRRLFMESPGRHMHEDFVIRSGWFINSAKLYSWLEIRNLKENLFRSVLEKFSERNPTNN